MDGIQSKHTGLVLTLLLLAVGVLVIKFASKLWPTVSIDSPSTYSYEMGRVQKYTGSFDLSQRDVDRKILQDEAETAGTQKVGDTAGKDKTAQKTDAKKNEKKQVAKKSSTADRKPIFLTTIIPDHEKKGSLSGSDDLISRTAYNQAGLNENPDLATSDKPDDDVLSAAKTNTKNSSQWKATLSSVPSMQNIQALLQAHRKGEITDGEFYQIAFDLFLDANKSHEQAGYLLLSIDSSASGFTFMAREYGNVSEAKRTQLWKIMLSYSRPDHALALNNALALNEKNVVHLALLVLQSTLNAAKVQSSGSLTLFIPSLNQIIQRGDENSALATTLLGLVRNT